MALLPNLTVLQGLRFGEGPIPFLSKYRKGDILFSFQSLLYKVADLQRKGDTFPIRKPFDGMIKGLFQYYINSRIFGWHNLHLPLTV